MCGVFAITGSPDAAQQTFLGLFALQHRGQESAGITTLAPDGTLHNRCGPGLVAEVFPQEHVGRMPGAHAIGHVRYSTAGGQHVANIQPLEARVAGVPVALAHNGNIANAAALRAELEGAGSILRGTSDTELILHLMARSAASALLDRFEDACNRLIGAFSVLMLTPTQIFAAVDPCGYRPLVLGERDEGDRRAQIICSETCALDLVGARYLRDLAPGELLCVDLESGGTSVRSLPMRTEQSRTGEQARCVFEHIYFARPDSLLWGQSPARMRKLFGAALAREHPAAAEVVVAIPDSGVPIAMGYAQASGIPLELGLVRNHYVGRTFIEPTPQSRSFRVKLKLNPVRDVVEGKAIVLVDDSIVRGTTSRKIIEHLREAGAREVHVRVGSPPVRFPCFYGIDTPKRKELLATRMGVDEMRDFLRADSLAFLSEARLATVLRENSAAAGRPPEGQAGFCMSCFSGQYQDASAAGLVST